MKIEIAKYIREPVNNIVENSTLESLGESEENFQKNKIKKGWETCSKNAKSLNFKPQYVKRSKSI